MAAGGDRAGRDRALEVAGRALDTAEHLGMAAPTADLRVLLARFFRKKASPGAGSGVLAPMTLRGSSWN